MSTLARTTLVMALVVSNAGCMTSTTRFLTIDDATHADRGDEVELVMADGREITGTVGASDDKTVVIDGTAGHKRVSIDEIASMKRHVYKVLGKPYDAGARWSASARSSVSASRQMQS